MGVSQKPVTGSSVKEEMMIIVGYTKAKRN